MAEISMDWTTQYQVVESEQAPERNLEGFEL